MSQVPIPSPAGAFARPTGPDAFFQETSDAHPAIHHALSSTTFLAAHTNSAGVTMGMAPSVPVPFPGQADICAKQDACTRHDNGRMT